MGEQLDPRAADEVLRRAAELSAASFPDLPAPGIDRRSLTEAASEVGIEPRAVELALAEHDTGLLGPDAGRGGVLGPSRVVEARVVELDRDRARAELLRWLRGQLLARDERRGEIELWRPREDLGAKVRRKVDARVGRRVRLAELDAVAVSTAPAGEGRTLIRLEAVFDDLHRGLFAGAVVLPAAVTPALGIVLGVLIDPWVVLASLPVAGTLGGVGAYAGRHSLADQRERAGRVLRGFLDQLEDAAAR